MPIHVNGHMKINSMNHVKFVKDNVAGSVKFVRIDVTVPGFEASDVQTSGDDSWDDKCESEQQVLMFC